MWNARTTKDDVKQTSYLARAIPLYLLSKRGIQMKEFTEISKGTFPNPPSLECLRTKAFLTVRSNLAKECNDMLRKHGKELEEMCAKLDISDEQLYASFQTAMSIIWESKNLTRLVSLFVFTSVLSARVCHEQHPHIESIFCWFEGFLEEHVVPWIRELGGWCELLTGVRMSTSKLLLLGAVIGVCATAIIAIIVD